MSPADATRLQLFLALFFMAVGFLFTLLCCGTDYWLLAAESCGGPGAGVGGALSGRKAHHINAPPPPSHMVRAWPGLLFLRQHSGCRSLKIRIYGNIFAFCCL